MANDNDARTIKAIYNTGDRAAAVVLYDEETQDYFYAVMRKDVVAADIETYQHVGPFPTEKDADFNLHLVVSKDLTRIWPDKSMTLVQFRAREWSAAAGRYISNTWSRKALEKFCDESLVAKIMRGKQS